jgi:3-oxoacyl-[acyl-carrier protein] reductase
VDEIKAAGGDAIAVGGDVAADDFPAKILDATIKYATPISPLHTVTCSNFFYLSLSYSVPFFLICFVLLFQAVRQAEPHRQ